MLIIIKPCTCFAARSYIYNLTKFARDLKAHGGIMCKVDFQALSYVKILSETHLSLQTASAGK